MKMPKILFFIAGMAPTRDEAEALAKIGIASARNASMISDTDRMEACDAVAGEKIPKPYADKPVVKTLEAAVDIAKKKQKAENADILAEMGKETTGVAGKDAKAKGTDGGGGKATGWTANA